MGEYHFIHYPGYYGKWHDPVCNHTYNGQGASWIISEYNGKHFMEQMRIRNDKPHRTFPMLTSGDRFWRDYTITASVRMFTTKLDREVRFDGTRAAYAQWRKDNA